MTNAPSFAAPDRSHLLLDFALRFYTALRTIRLYPPTNPQVQRSNEAMIQSLQALLETTPEDAVVLALSDRKLLVCGEHLADKEQQRPQVQGLITLFSRAKIHSLSFQPSLSLNECVTLTQTLSTLLGEKDPKETVAALLDRAGIVSVSADTQRYVAIREGEQVVREELLGVGLHVSDEELANFVLGRQGEGAGVAGVSRDLVQELINRLPATGQSGQHSETLSEAVIQLLQQLSRDYEQRKRTQNTGKNEASHAAIDPFLLAQLIAKLPNSAEADTVLGSALEQMPPDQINTLIARLIAQQPKTGGNDAPAGQPQGLSPSPLQRLLNLEQARQPAINSVIAQNIDASSLLRNPQTTLAELPEHLLIRLREPEWSAPVIASAARQVAEGQQNGGSIDFAAFNTMLANYEQLLSRDQQQQVARQAGERMASMEGLALGSIIAHKFRGLFGAQLYEQVINQVSDELLDETVEHLSPKQLNRMIATLTSDIPLHIGKDGDPQFKPADDALLKRLARTSKGPEITKTIAQNIDASSLLRNPATTLAELPEHLLARLRQPEWSAPVIASAAQQVAEGQQNGGSVDFAAFNTMLANYEQLLSRDQQQQVARQAGERMASMEGLALGSIIAHKFRGLFGAQLYEQVINQVSDELLDETVEHLSPKQLNRMIATLTSDIPLHIGKDGDPQFKPADDALLKRLARTSKGPEITKTIAQNIDASSLLRNPATTLAELPEHLLARLRQPEWSAPVIASAAQQVAEGQQNGGSVDFAAFNTMLANYEQLLSRDQQQQVARQAGERMASMEGLALGSIIAHKFRGLFGAQLYEQVINQVSDELLDETVEHLSPKQLNRMIATLTSDIPLHIGKDGNPQFKPADDALLKRLARTSKGPEITKTIAQNIDASSLLRNPATTLAELPEHLLARLRQPEWSAPVIAAAAQQVAEGQQNGGSVDFAAFNTMLANYEQLLSRDQQQQVARQAGERMASMEGLALGSIIAHKFRGLFGAQLYEQVINQVSDELLDETVEHLRPKQLNRMIATLTSNIPLHIGKDGDPQFKPADDALLKRLARTSRGPEVTKAIAQNIDASSLLHAGQEAVELSEQLTMRLQQPAWSAPVLLAAARQVLDQDQGQGKIDLVAFEQLLDRYDALLNREKQLQVANQVAPQLAALEEQELGLLLVKKYKNLFGEQLYQQVIAQLSPAKLERLTAQFRALAEGRASKPSDLDNKEIEAAYHSLQETVRGEKMRAIVEMHREQQKQQQEDLKLTVEASMERLINGERGELADIRLVEALPQRIRSLLLDNQEGTGDSLIMQLALALQHQQSEIRAHGFRALAVTAEQLVHIGQWPRCAKLLPALQQGLQQPQCDAESSRQALAAIGALIGHYLSREEYPAALEIVHFLQTLTTASGTAPQVRDQAKETLRALCSKPVLEQLLDRHLHDEAHQEPTGRLLVELGPESAQYQLQQLFDSESRFERKRLLTLIKQTGNPALSMLLEQLHKDSPWFVLRNSIRLLGEIGNPALFTKVRAFVQHSDPRVQQEVITTATKIGGDQLRDFLLQALQQVDDSLKIRVINHMAMAHDERFVRPLTDLLESAKPFLGKNKNDLQLSLCKTLGAIGSKRATASLVRVAQSKNVLGLGGYSDEVRQAAAEALDQIRLANEGQRDTEAEPAATWTSTPLPASGTATNQSGGDDAQEGLTLNDIIESQGGDETPPSGTTRPEDLAVWAELTDRLGSEEFQAILQVFSERQCRPEETIVSQGDKNDALIFINQGSLKVSHMVGPRELFITSLNRGQLAGENFFTPSLWTVTLTALTPCRLYLLPQKALAQWQQQYPSLRAKLYEYYRAYNNIGFMLKKKGLDRRQDQRYSLSRKIQVQPISNLDTPIGRGFRAETADISLGGIAFLVRIAHQENARLLLGRRMQIVLPVGGKTGHLLCKGLVIGIQPFQLRSNDFSVHFKFDQPLDRPVLQSILG